MPTTVSTIARHRPGDPNAVRIDRATSWGNPYRIRGGLTREGVLHLYARHLRRIGRHNPRLRRDVAALSGKTLLCHCAPKRCHGDVLRLVADDLAAGRSWHDATAAAVAWAWELRRPYKRARQGALL